jgi:AcrR family transcriptional regulator
MTRQSTDVRRRQIADAALEIISRDGLGRFTTAAIAAEIGISEGALFRHFGNKAAIVEAAVDLIEELLGEFPLSSDADPIAQLGTFFRARVELMRRRPGVFRILFSQQLAQAASAESVARLRRMQQRSLQFVRSRLEQAAELGLLKPGLQVPALVLIIQGSALAVAFGATCDQTSVAAPTDQLWPTLESLLRK